MKTATLVSEKGLPFDFYVGLKACAHVLAGICHCFCVHRSPSILNRVSFKSWKAFVWNEYNSNPEFKRLIHKYQGKRLACWCRQSDCSGAAIVALVNYVSSVIVPSLASSLREPAKPVVPFLELGDAELAREAVKVELPSFEGEQNLVACSWCASWDKVRLTEPNRPCDDCGRITAAIVVDRYEGEDATFLLHRASVAPNMNDELPRYEAVSFYNKEEWAPVKEEPCQHRGKGVECYCLIAPWEAMGSLDVTSSRHRRVGPKRLVTGFSAKDRRAVSDQNRAAFGEYASTTAEDTHLQDEWRDYDNTDRLLSQFIEPEIDEILLEAQAEAARMLGIGKPHRKELR